MKNRMDLCRERTEHMNFLVKWLSNANPIQQSNTNPSCQIKDAMNIKYGGANGML